MSMSVPTQEELDSMPHVFFTADTPWDPTVLDNEFSAATFNTPEKAIGRNVRFGLFKLET